MSVSTPRTAHSGGRRRKSNLLLGAPALVLVLGLLAPAPGLAQAPESEVRLKLVSQPLFHERNDRLDLKVRIFNDGSATLDGLTLNFNLLFRETSRFGLQQSYEERAGLGASAESRALDITIDPDESSIVTANPRVSDLVEATGSTAEGVYPLVVSLLDADFVPVASFVTPVLYYPNKIETPLKFVLVVPLNDVPARAADGTYNGGAVSEAGGESLEGAIQEEGWLRETLDALRPDRRNRVRAGVAPTPRLIEEIAGMRRGYSTESAEISDNSDQAEAAKSFVADLTSLLQSNGVQPLLVPYAYPDLPVLAQSPLSDHVAIQVSEGEAVFDSLLGGSPGREWLLPPAGRLDEASVGALDTATAERSFFIERALTQGLDPLASNCANPSLTFTCPVSVDTPQGSIEGYVADQGLQDRLASLSRPGEDRLDLQRFFAETAMIREEQPSEEARVVQATLPALWRPASRTIRLLYGGFANAPWLKTVTPHKGLRLDIESVERQLVDVAPHQENQLNDFELAEIAEAESRVDQFSQMQPPDPLIQRMNRNILVAESLSWWSDPDVATSGLSYATDTTDEIDGITDRIRVEVSDVITLTSRSEDIPMRVVNQTGFPVRLALSIDSTALTATVAQDPQIFPTEVTPVTVGVRSETSGVSELGIQLSMPNCFEDSCVVFERDATIRSTDFNNVALTITIGALAFLIGFYALRWVRRHRESPEGGVGRV